MNNNDLFEERSHSKLKTSFRIGLNLENGHRVKVVFNLDINDITKIGSTMYGTDTHDEEIIKKIPKTGHNDFLSKGIIKSITDVDTNQQLEYVHLIGISNSKLFDVSNFFTENIEKEIKTYLKNNSNEFYKHVYQNDVEFREIISKSSRWRPAFRYIYKLTKGEKEFVPSYKSTKLEMDAVKAMKNMDDPIRTGRGIVTYSESVESETLKQFITFCCNRQKIGKLTPTDYKTLSSEMVKYCQTKEERGARDNIVIKQYKNIPHNDIFIEIGTSPNIKDVKRYMELRSGRIQGSLVPEHGIELYVTEDIFKHSPESIFNTLTDLCLNYWKYYRDIGDLISKELVKLGPVGLKLIKETDLSYIIILMMKSVCIFSNVSIDPSKKSSLTNKMKDNKKMISKYFSYIRNLVNVKNDKSLENKSLFIKDINKMISEVKKYSNINTNLNKLIPAIENLYVGKFNKFIKESIQAIYDENTEPGVRTIHNSTLYLTEARRYKKLKKIPSDIVAYVIIEGENAKTNNDKLMIVSYCLNWVSIVEWYIELIETGSKDYLVPHSKEYLTNIRIQLLAAYKKIMDTKINPNRPLIDIRYPSGYEG